MTRLLTETRMPRRLRRFGPGSAGEISIGRASRILLATAFPSFLALMHFIAGDYSEGLCLILVVALILPIPLSDRLWPRWWKRYPLISGISLLVIMALAFRLNQELTALRQASEARREARLEQRMKASGSAVSPRIVR